MKIKIYSVLIALSFLFVSDIYAEKFYMLNELEKQILVADIISSKVLNNKGQKDDKYFPIIEKIVNTYIERDKKPENILRLLLNLNPNLSLNESQEDEVQEWITFSKNWQQANINVSKSLVGDDLFISAKKLLDGEEDSLNVDKTRKSTIQKASMMLIHYVFSFSSGKFKDEALYLLGSIQHRTWNLSEFYVEHFYLKELIRRYPRSEYVSRAYLQLEDSIITAYSGSGGNFTPISHRQRLKKMKETINLK